MMSRATYKGMLSFGCLDRQYLREVACPRIEDQHMSRQAINCHKTMHDCGNMMLIASVIPGMKIEWYPDECAQPLPKMQNHLKKENQRLRQIQKPTAAINRFQMLGIDGSEDGSSGEEEPTVSSDFSPLRIGARSPWNPGSVAA